MSGLDSDGIYWLGRALEDGWELRAFQAQGDSVDSPEATYEATGLTGETLACPDLLTLLSVLAGIAYENHS